MFGENKNEYFIDLKWKQNLELTQNEKRIWKEQTKIWGIYKGDDDRLYCNRDNPKSGLFMFLGCIEEKCESILYKCEKIFIYYGEFIDNWLYEWKHPDDEFKALLRNACK
jgi:hypothetical protein